MTFLGALKGRLPRMLPVAAALLALGGGGAAAYKYLYAGDCCAEGASCCRPGAACCLKHHHADAKPLAER